MERIEAESTRMSGLVEDLLTLARIDDSARSSIDARSTSPSSAADAVAGRPGACAPTGASRLHRPRRAGRPDRGARRRAAAAPGGHQPRRQRPAAHPGGTPVEVAVGNDVERCRPRGARPRPRRDPTQVATKVFERFYRADPRAAGAHRSAAAAASGWRSSRPSSARTTARSASPRPPAAARPSWSASHSMTPSDAIRSSCTSTEVDWGQSPRGAREP